MQQDLQVILAEKARGYTFPFAHSLELHANVFAEQNIAASDQLSELQACIELLILALDIIDDMQDQDNHESVWMKGNPALTLNASISLLTIFQSHLTEISNNNYITQNILKYLLQSIEGQHQDLYGVEDVNGYLEMTKHKSGSLMALTNVLGASFVNSDYNHIIEDYSYDLGIIAQITNDIQDALNFDEKSDWKSKKKTLPILYLLNPSIKEGEIIKKYFNNQLSFEELLPHKNEIITIMKHSGALNFAFAQKYIHENRVMQKIDSLPLSPQKKRFLSEQLLKPNQLQVEMESI